MTKNGFLVPQSPLKEILVSLEDPMRFDIIWDLKIAQSNFSFASSDGLNEVFKLMFGDSAKTSAWMKPRNNI